MSKILNTLIAAGLIAITPAAYAQSTTETPTTEEAVTEEAMAEPLVIDEALAQKGKKKFKKCKACHKVGDKAKHGVGPMLNGIFDRAVATGEGFKYSKGMIALGGEGAIWDAETLDTFLAKPKDMVKKTKMSFAGLKKEKDRLAVIEYLKLVSK